MGEPSPSKITPPFPRSRSSTSTASHSTQDSSTQDDILLLTIAKHGAEAIIQILEEALHCGGHRRIVSYDDTYEGSEDLKLKAAAPYETPVLPRPVSTFEMDN